VYYTRAMRKNGEMPLCIGKKSTLTRKIPVEKLEELDKKTSKADLETYVCIGYSQMSGRMERTGKLPVCINGIQFHFVSATDAAGKKSSSAAVTSSSASSSSASSSSSSSSLSPSPSSSATAPGPAASSVPTSEGAGGTVPPTKGGARTGQEEMVVALSGFKTIMEKGVKKQYNSMVKFYTQTADKFPEKVYRSYSALVASSAKTLDRIEKGFNKIWSYYRK
jgi:hypothetical protein